MVEDVGAILAMMGGVGAKNSFQSPPGAGLLLRQDHLIGNVGAGELLARLAWDALRRESAIAVPSSPHGESAKADSWPQA